MGSAFISHRAFATIKIFSLAHVIDGDMHAGNRNPPIAQGLLRA
jgi:hypothetical protein